MKNKMILKAFFGAVTLVGFVFEMVAIFNTTDKWDSIWIISGAILVVFGVYKYMQVLLDDIFNGWE